MCQMLERKKCLRRLASLSVHQPESSHASLKRRQMQFRSVMPSQVCVLVARKHKHESSVLCATSINHFRTGDAGRHLTVSLSLSL